MNTTGLPSAAPDGFGAWFAQTLVASGLDVDDVAAAIGISRHAVINWWTGATRPATARLVTLADTLDVPLSTLCEAAGKPPNDALRAAFGRDHATSLPGMLRSWKDRHGLTTREAGAAIGIRYEHVARLCCGSVQPGRRVLRRLAAATGIDLVTLTDAAWPGLDAKSDGYRTWARNWVRPSAQLLRDALGHDGATDATLDASGVPAALVTDVADGSRVPTVEECVALARATGVDLLALLVASDVDPVDATALAAEVTAASQLPYPPDARKLVQDFRARPYVDTAGRTRKQVSWGWLADQVGISRPNLIHVVAIGDRDTMPVDACRRLADTIGQPRELLLAGFGHTI